MVTWSFAEELWWINEDFVHFLFIITKARVYLGRMFSGNSNTFCEKGRVGKGYSFQLSPFFLSALIALLSIILSPHWKHLSFGIQHHCWTQHRIIYFYSTKKELLDSYEFKVNWWTYYTLLSISVPCGDGGRCEQLQYCTHIPKNLTTMQLSA